ncbi:helix-turn-helix domain-containing protein [Sphaerisporangium siamense]|uniref:XRE family transcriptional regulator n=1 Tax=Sphaerisporangium siamense TaxID=795645 RepID=A0A7W7DCG5_9ACTN|nr:hypothetical protein [Sphaerisporangium siamense]MBB4703146.1 hypothetical protein [Sphaerisporangium siamense]
MRQLKTWSGMTYRQLEERAEAVGEVLPRSTLAGALDRDRLPRVAVVEAFTKACGCDGDTVAAWTALARRLVDAAPPEPGPETSPPPGPEAAPQPSRRPTGAVRPGAKARAADGWEVGSSVRALLNLAAYAVAILSLVWADTPGTGAERPAARAEPAVGGAHPSGSGMPEAGRYRVRLLPSNLCLSEKPGSDLGLVYQAPCTSGFPVTLHPEPGGAGVYRVATVHPVFGDGCMGVDKADGLVNTFCDDEGFSRYLRLETVTAPVSGVRLRVPGRAGCVGVHESDRARAWARLALRTCSSSMAGQVVLFERLPGD